MKRLFFIALSTVLTACTSSGGPNSAAQDPALSAFRQYIIVGDSLMDFSADGELTTTASLILLEENTSVVNISRAGQSMAGVGGVGGAERDGVSGAVNYLTAYGRNPRGVRPGTAVIVELAHNDWSISTPADDLFSSYVRFLEAIDRGNNAVSVFCILPIAATWDYDGHQNANGMTYEALRGVVRKIAGTGLCNLVDTTGWFSKEDVNDPLIMPDGLHLAAGGHRIYKDRLMQELRKYTKTAFEGSKDPGENAPGMPGP
jgi:hypothetical protein